MHRDLQDVIVGSGPTAYAAALGVLSDGRRPVVIDFGAEPRVDAHDRRGAATLAEKSDGSVLDPFAYPRELIVNDGVGALPLSSARGGLSTIWGAGVLVRDRQDMPELDPVADGIERGYDALLSSIRLAGDDDRMSERFPWPVRTESVPASVRFGALRDRVGRLPVNRILMGGPRLALDAPACVRCGRCLTGCPERLFFSSADAFGALDRSGEVDLVTGPVIRIEADGSLARVVTPHEVIRAERVHVAAGPIATPALLQRSGLVGPAIIVRDSAVFYAAMLNTNPSTGDEQAFTASQLMIAATVPGDDDFVLSVYESNEEFRERLARLLHLPARIIPFPSALRTRINAVIGSLPMSVSGTIELLFRSGRTAVVTKSNRRTRPAAVRALQTVQEELVGTGLRPLASTVVVPAPGSSYHSGCGLPMGGADLDWSGRLRRLPAVRVVDASALPALWPGSHTFTAMANAYRIGADAA